MSYTITHTTRPASDTEQVIVDLTEYIEEIRWLRRRISDLEDETKQLKTANDILAKVCQRLEDERNAAQAALTDTSISTVL